MLLKNKTAVLTCCSRGIGKETLNVLSKNGASVFACVRKIDKEFLDYTKKLEVQFKNNIYPIEIDLSKEENVKSSAEKILKQGIPIDILINNAGIIHTAIFQMTSIKKLREIFETNYFSQTLFTQYMLKSMTKNKKGSIIYISSSSAIDGDEGRSAYSSSKAAIISHAKVLSKELGKINIRVNVIAPGPTNTRMMLENTPKTMHEEIKSKISLKRFGEANEIASAILFFSSDLSNFVTGQVLRVDGGM